MAQPHGIGKYLGAPFLRVAFTPTGSGQRWGLFASESVSGKATYQDLAPWSDDKFRKGDETVRNRVGSCNKPTRHYSLARAMSRRAHNGGSIISSPATVTDTAPARNKGAPEK